MVFPIMQGVKIFTYITICLGMSNGKRSPLGTSGHGVTNSWEPNSEVNHTQASVSRRKEYASAGLYQAPTAFALGVRTHFV